MVTGYEVDMYHDISLIARSLNRMANCAEAELKLKREADRPAWINETLERAAAMMAARTSVRRGFEDLEAAVNDQRLSQAEPVRFGNDPLAGLSFGDFNDLEGHSEWKLAVTRDETILSYTQWRAWKGSNDPNNV